MGFLKNISFSIITVCYNEQKNIKRTLESVLKQNYSVFEQIICDGGSTDKTNEIIRSYLPKFEKKGIKVKYISKKDGGIYFGMNNGINLAQNDYCIFLNGGDSFYNENVLNKVNQHLQLNQPDVIYGNSYNVGKRESYLNICNHKSLPHGDQLSHQSSFIKTSLLKQRKYDTKYRLAADYEYFLYLYNNGRSFKHINTIISNFYLDGISYNSYQTCFNEAEKIKKLYSKKYGFPIYDGRKLNANVIHIKHNKINKLCGWSAPEKNGTWCTDNKSKFNVCFSKVKSYYMIINYDIDLHYKIKLKVNGEITSLEKDDYLKNYTAHISKELLKEGVNEFEIISNKVRPVDSNKKIKDHRKCKLFIKSIDFISEKKKKKLQFFDMLRLQINGNIKQSGWYKREGLSVWTINGKVTALLYINVKQGFTYFIDLKILKNNYEISHIKINSHFIGAITNDVNSYCLKIPNKYLKDGYNEVAIETKGRFKKDEIIKNKLIRRIRIKKCLIKE